MDAIGKPRKAEDVFNDFIRRRAGLIKALTVDVRAFYQLCDPERENLCLYGLPSEEWEVNLPVDEVPPELPEPALGINFARDGMKEKDWLALVAVHSDAWLLSLAFYFGARFGFGKTERRRLFEMINDIPTIYEAVSGAAVKNTKDQVKTQNIGSRSKSSNKTSRLSSESLPKGVKKNPPPKYEADSAEEEEDDEQGETLCGACGDNYSEDEFWICCDLCERWFHGNCVKITPAKAEHIKHYKCPSCSTKRARHQD